MWILPLLLQIKIREKWRVHLLQKNSQINSNPHKRININTITLGQKYEKLVKEIERGKPSPIIKPNLNAAKTSVYRNTPEG